MFFYIIIFYSLLINNNINANVNKCYGCQNFKLIKRNKCYITNNYNLNKMKHIHKCILYKNITNSFNNELLTEYDYFTINDK
jgi:hypothetical protein